MADRALFAFALAMSAALLFGCGSKTYDEKTCAQYRDAFIRSCNDTCTKSLERDVCAPRCAEALPKDPSYATKCLAAGSASASK